MGDEDERAIIVEEGLLEDFLRLHVEMVRRFVEDQQVVWLEEELEECQARALTTAEHLDLLRRSFAAEHKGAEEILDLRADLASATSSMVWKTVRVSSSMAA